MNLRSLFFELGVLIRAFSVVAILGTDPYWCCSCSYPLVSETSVTGKLHIMSAYMRLASILVGEIVSSFISFLMSLEVHKNEVYHIWLGCMERNCVTDKNKRVMRPRIVISILVLSLKSLTKTI